MGNLIFLLWRFYSYTVVVVKVQALPLWQLRVFYKHAINSTGKGVMYVWFSHSSNKCSIWIPALQLYILCFLKPCLVLLWKHFQCLGEHQHLMNAEVKDKIISIKNIYIKTELLQIKKCPFDRTMHKMFFSFSSCFIKDMYMYLMSLSCVDCCNCSPPRAVMELQHQFMKRFAQLIRFCWFSSYVQFETLSLSCFLSSVLTGQLPTLNTAL